ncbi:ptk6 protein tyrosine kinase [Desmophyllum pertusum]|uniref:Ptk6 protein tyrosine kinase n=1 Tax=Desmophyllum pertusum TaxID=174260 RepID=A0A9W9YL47_9CNID|nr:ptk6 protein tyrosine kinase [Desmophyllum pertusum]
MEDGSSLCSSEASSQISDDYSSYNDRRKPVKQVTHIKVTNCAGPFVVGRKGKIEVAQPRDDNHLVLPSTSAAQASLPPDPSPSEVVDAVIDTGISEENISQFGENCQGSYCPVINCRQQCGTEKEPKWNARPSAGQGILFNKGGLEFQWSIKTFLENPEKFIQDMDINAGSLKEEKEDFILHKILPDLEESWGKCFSSNEEIYKILAKISCSGKSGKVVRQALQLLLHLICKDNFDSCNQNLLGVEAITRSSILSPDGLLKNDRHSERELKLYVYSRILSSLVIQQVRQGELPIVAALEQDLKKLQDELKRFSNQLNTKKKDGVRYSMEFILKAISYLLKPHDKLKGFLDECQEFCLNQEINSNELKVLRKLKKNGEWIDLHCILIHLHGKVHSERPKPRMETERRAMMLLRLLVETYLEGGGGDDWRFCLLAASILSDIGMNSATKEMRQEAGGCLVNLLKDANVQKRPECRACLERRSSEVLFCPDRVTKTILVHFLSKNQNLQHELPADLLIEHLSSKYRTQTLEINKTTISQSLSCFVNHGMFQRKKVAVKVLFVKKKHLLEEDPIFHAKERLIREADNLRRLNQSHHANIPVLLSYDTKSLPYHLITAFERWGDLLQFVRRSRERRPHLKPIQLLEMLIDIANALLYLEKEGLVHRAVMATNVLVGDNYDCKLSGMHSLQQLTNQTENSDSLYSYCSVDDGWPEFISKTNDEELPVRWKAPECLLEHRYTTASDVWAFGVLMYEVLTYGCLPYRHILNDDEVSFRVMDADGKEALPFESCFEEKEHELMMQCCERQRYIRLKLSEVKAKLSEMHENADEQQSRPDPPSLDMHVTYESYELGNSKETYDSISGSVYNECSFQFNREMVEGVSVVSEKITRGDVQHLRKLLALNHPNLVSIWKIDNLDSHCPTVDVISKEAPLGNVKEYVLDRRCQKEDIITSAPEVILDGHYTHASDVWAFGILAWELYKSFSTGQDGRPVSVPFFDLDNREGEPMKSWIMTLWLRNQHKSEWPDLSISQTEGACHVTDAEQHPKKEVVEKMCSEEFFGKHNYKYIDITSDIAGGRRIREGRTALRLFVVLESSNS